MNSLILTQTVKMAEWITKMHITDQSLIAELILHKTRNTYV